MPDGTMPYERKLALITAGSMYESLTLLEFCAEPVPAAISALKPPSPPIRSRRPSAVSF